MLILSGEIENMLTKTQRNETEQQKHCIYLDCNQDGIIEINLNAIDLHRNMWTSFYENHIFLLMNHVDFYASNCIDEKFVDPLHGFWHRIFGKPQ